MSAYLELLQHGRLGPDGATLLYNVAATVARVDRLRPFDGTEGWGAEHTTELAHDFLADGRTAKRVATIMGRATDDDSLRAMLTTAVRNFVRDRLRTTDHGALRRKLRVALEEDGRVQRRDGPLGEAWAIPDTPDVEPWNQGPTGLVGAAWAIDAPLQRWRSEHRRDPVTTDDSLVAVCVAIIEEAQQPVTTATLTEVCLRRFALARTPDVVDLGDEPLAAATDVEATVVLDDTVAHLLDQLTEEELLLLSHWELPVRQLAGLLGLGKSAAAVRVNRLEVRMTEMLGPREDAEDVWGALVRAAHDWWDIRTDAGGATFDEGERS